MNLSWPVIGLMVISAIVGWSVSKFLDNRLKSVVDDVALIRGAEIPDEPPHKVRPLLVTQRFNESRDPLQILVLIHELLHQVLDEDG